MKINVYREDLRINPIFHFQKKRRKEQLTVKNEKNDENFTTHRKTWVKTC